jgi:hypothetical protein
MRYGSGGFDDLEKTAPADRLEGWNPAMFSYDTTVAEMKNEILSH